MLAYDYAQELQLQIDLAPVALPLTNSPPPCADDQV